jgi:hypothetical protein
MNCLPSLDLFLLRPLSMDFGSWAGLPLKSMLPGHLLLK